MTRAVHPRRSTRRVAPLALALAASVIVPGAAGVAAEPRLELRVGDGADAGTAVVEVVLADASDDVAAFELAASVPLGAATVDAGDAGAARDLSIADLGADAVLAGIGPDDRRGDDLVLGRFVVRPERPVPVHLALGGVLVVGSDGSARPVAGDRQVVAVLPGSTSAEPGDVAPAARAPISVPAGPARTLGDVDGDGRVGVADAREVQARWHLAREAADGGCDELDLNGNGCVDVGDVLLAERKVPAGASLTGRLEQRSAAATTGTTFTVNSTGDGWDVTVGNGVCASAPGVCTLRAAIQEANAAPGPNTIAFNIPGTGPHTIQLTQRLPTINDTSGPVTIDGYTEPGSAPNNHPVASNAVLNIAVRGGGAAAYDAFTFTSGGNTLRGVAVYDVRKPVWLYTTGSAGNRIVGSFIGTDPSGTFVAAGLATLAYGINAEQDAPGTVIGTPALADRNVISGNAAQGIGFWHNKTDGAVIQNNIIGLSPDGSRAVPNRRHAVDLNFGVSGTRIGGTGANERNVLSGNDGSGVEISHTTGTRDNRIVGNFIGTDLTGTTSPAYARNGEAGVYVEDGSTANVIEGNTIVRSVRTGITVVNGGTNGVTTGTVVRGNLIGIVGDATPFGNSGAGVLVNGSGTLVEGNIIAGNTGAGIVSNEPTASGNRFTANVIYGNTGLPIDLSPLGVVNPDDADDADTGPNGLLNPPAWARASDRVLVGTACPGCRVEVFTSVGGSNRPLTGLVAATTANTTGAWVIASPTVAVGTALAATATDPGGSTSEVSTVVTTTEHNDPPVVTVTPSGPAVEGTDVALSGSATDPDGDAVALAWDLDGDGTFEAPGPNAVLAGAGLDGPGTATVRLRGTDARGLSTTVPATITVTNRAPTATLVAPAGAAEGAPFTVQLVDATDAGADRDAGLRYAFSCTGATAVPAYADASTSPAATCTVPDGPASATVRASVLDDDGGVTTYAATVATANVAPGIQLVGVPQTLDEGAGVVLAATVSDASPPDAAAGIGVTWAVDGASGTGPTFTFAPSDDGAVTVQATATDKDGGSATATAPVTVTNVAPSGRFETDVSAAAGTITATLAVVDATDPSAADRAAGLRFAFACDGASLAGVTYAAASTASSRTCTWTDGVSNHPVRAVVLDKDGGRSEYTSTASTGGAPPTVQVAASFTVAEGATVGLTADGANATGGALTYAWDLDDDGTFETAGRTPTFTAAALDGPVTVPIAVRVTNADGAATSARSEVRVTNVSPTGVLPSVTVDEGRATTASIGSITDVPADLTGLRYAIACDGASLDAVTYATASASPSASCTYPDGPATVGLRARIFDDDGASTTLTATVTVANRGPVVAFGTVPTGVGEGTAVSVPYSVTDVDADVAGLGSSWVVLHDGSVVASGSASPVAFTTADDGAHVVRVTATDADGGLTVAEATVGVDGGAPTGTLVLPPDAVEGSTVTVAMIDVSDPSPADVAAGLRLAVSCTGASLDGATYASASSALSVPCPAPDGPATMLVRARVVDRNGAFTEYTGTVTVANAAPTARFVAPAEVVAGEPFTLSADQLDDPSAADEPTLAVALSCTPTPGATTATTITCPAAAGPTTTVSARIRDRHGAETTYTAMVVVHPNLLANAGFETDADGDGRADGWTWPAGMTRTGPGRSGAVAARQTASTATTSMLVRDVTVQARRPYEYGAWVNVSGTGSSSVAVRVRWLDAAGAVLATIPTASVETTTTGWLRLARQYVAPTGAVKARYEVVATSSVGRTVAVDDTFLTAANDLLNPELDLDANGDGRPDTWFQTGRFLRNSTVVHRGTASGALDGDGTTFSPGQRIYNLVPGARYHVSLWVRVDEPDGQFSVQPRIRWLTSADTTIRLDVLPTVRSTPGWVQIAGSFTAPAGVTDTLLEVTFYYLEGVAYLDSAYLGQA